MRRLVLFAMLLAGALNASAAEPVTTVQVTVAQLEQFLAAQQAAQASDGATAQELRSVELTEQLTESALERMKAAYRPGTETATGLEVLTDLSAFSKPAAGEIPARSAPTQAEQQEMLGAAAKFVSVTLKHLPDFLAIRTFTGYRRFGSTAHVVPNTTAR